MNTPELTQSQKELFNKILAKGFSQGVVSMVRCMRSVAAQAKRDDRPEPTLTELAKIIETKLAEKNNAKKN
jgi:predicted Ser/Thr protein kinase